MFTVQRKFVALSIVLASAIGLSACASSPGASTPSAGGESRVSVAITGLNSLQIWAMVAQDYQLMKPWGINLDVVTLAGMSKVVPALLSGDVQFASATPEQAMSAHLQQPDLEMVISSYNANPYVVVAAKGISELKDLKGKIIGVNGLGSSADYFGAKIALSEVGLTEGDDYTFIQAGNTAQRVAALSSGQIDALLTWEPDVSRAVEAGGHAIYSLADSPKLVGAQFAAFVALSSWYDDSKNKEVAARWVRGYQDTIRWVQDPANKGKVVESITKNLGVSSTLAETTYKQFVVDMPAENPVGTVSEPALKLTLQNAQAAGVATLQGVDPSGLGKFYDNSLTQAAEALKH